MTTYCATGRGMPIILFARTATKLHRALLAADPPLRRLPFVMRSFPMVHFDAFYADLKTVLFIRAEVGSAPA